MPTVQIDVTAKTTVDGLELEAVQGDDVIRSMIIIDELTTVDGLAAWLIAQAGRPETTSGLQKRLTITYHTESVTDTETGQPFDQKIIDSVIVAPLPQDDGRANFQSLTGWATWTGPEAESWITNNVTDLASAKIALTAMAKAIVYLRNICID